MLPVVPDDDVDVDVDVDGLELVAGLCDDALGPTVADAVMDGVATGSATVDALDEGAMVVVVLTAMVVDVAGAVTVVVEVAVVGPVAVLTVAAGVVTDTELAATPVEVDAAVEAVDVDAFAKAPASADRSDRIAADGLPVTTELVVDDRDDVEAAAWLDVVAVEWLVVATLDDVVVLLRTRDIGPPGERSINSMNIIPVAGPFCELCQI